MTFLKILLGLAGLGVVVFIHELGHFLAARLTGIDVEAFSIGWGRPVLRKKIGAVEYRIGMFPLGGYCKMRGENEFKEAWENRKDSVEPVKGTFFGATPARRILVSFAGPFFNLIFAVLVLSAIWGAGVDVSTLENRVVLASEMGGQRAPADDGGLKTGDRILEINGKKISYYHDIQEQIAVNPEKKLPVTVERDGKTLSLEVRPALDKSTGAGRIGVYSWTAPVIGETVPGGPAAQAGMEKGDRILRVNGRELLYSAGLLPLLAEKPAVLDVDYERDGAERKAVLAPLYDGGEADLGMGWAMVHYRTPSLSPPAALAKGASESWKTLVVSLKSLSLLFRGIDLTQAVSGPMRITYMAGDIAAEGFGRGFAAGIRSMANFLSLISIALCIMNLLPLPVLDGGMIVLFIVEAIRRRPLHPRAVSVFQTVGVLIISGLMIFAVFGDILFLFRR
ncbi:MAG: site-2 protease family protein [Treponema sp.]|jgi:regulator of sigma E protease|nr:site-2 protease family protein [Treponema sp.]